MDELLKALSGLPFVDNVKRASVDDGIMFVYQGKDYVLTWHKNYVMLRQVFENDLSVVDVYTTIEPNKISVHDILWACDVWGE